MKNPIDKCNLFHTPESVEDLLEYCMQFSGNERTIAMTVLGMALNLSSEIIDKLIDNQ